MSLKSFFDKFIRRKEEEFNSHISPEVQAIIDARQPISLEKWKGMRLNSFERMRLYPLLDNEAFIATVRYYTAQCARPLGKFDVPATYCEALERYMVLELCNRLERKESTNVHRNVEERVLSC